jgi:hypothetical protein
MLRYPRIHGVGLISRLLMGTGMCSIAAGRRASIGIPEGQSSAAGRGSSSSTGVSTQRKPASSRW